MPASDHKVSGIVPLLPDGILSQSDTQYHIHLTVLFSPDFLDICHSWIFCIPKSAEIQKAACIAVGTIMHTATAISIQSGRIPAFFCFVAAYTFIKTFKFFSFASASPFLSLAGSGTAPKSSGKASRNVLYTTPQV